MSVLNNVHNSGRRFSACINNNECVNVCGRIELSFFFRHCLHSANVVLQNICKIYFEYAKYIHLHNVRTHRTFILKFTCIFIRVSHMTVRTVVRIQIFLGVWINMLHWCRINLFFGTKRIKRLLSLVVESNGK